MKKCQCVKLSIVGTMKSRKRVIYPGILNHCYQRGADGILLFYSVADHLVYFSLYCLLARKYQIQVLSLCQMPDHVHDTVAAQEAWQLSRFKQEVNARFSRMQNELCHWDGPVFESAFGSAPKLGAKKARTNLIYVGNNPVERQLSRHAECYRWNYLAYATSRHPFSKNLILNSCRHSMRKAWAEIKSQYKNGRPLTYALLKRIGEPLTSEERQQLTDAAIGLYNVIDYAAAIRFFDNCGDMLQAMHANSGSEYDLNEITVGRSDACYRQFTSLLLRTGRFQDIHQVLSLPADQRRNLRPLLLQADAHPSQVDKYLRLPFSKGR